jgi:putative membrane protein
MAEGAPAEGIPGPAAAEPPADSRLRLGLETTLLAWIRTGLALMGFGFVMARFGLFLRQWLEVSQRRAANGTGISLWFGIALIVLGVAVNLTAAWMHYPFMIRFRKGETDLPATWTIGITLAVVLALVGMVMAAFLMAIDS